jgi:hypothetical protein
MLCLECTCYCLNRFWIVWQTLLGFTEEPAPCSGSIGLGSPPLRLTEQEWFFFLAFALAGLS